MIVELFLISQLLAKKNLSFIRPVVDPVPIPESIRKVAEQPIYLKEVPVHITSYTGTGIGSADIRRRRRELFK